MANSRLRVCLAAAFSAVAFFSAGPSAAGTDEALVEAVKRNEISTVRDLLRRRVDVNIPDRDGSTPLLWAAHLGHHELLTLLLASGADVKVANAYGVTPLYEASTQGNAAIVDQLLRAGADPNDSVQLGETPIMAAARTSSVETVTLLASRGADVNARGGGQGQTALMRALAVDQTAIAKVLVDLGADVTTPSRASTLPHRNFSREPRIAVNHLTGGFTPLMFAARQGNRDAVHILLAAGASKNISYANPDGVSALMLTVVNGHWDLAVTLMEAGADVNDGSLYQAVDMHNIAADEFVSDVTRPLVLPTGNAVGPVEVIARMLKSRADPNLVFSKILHMNGTQPMALFTDTPLRRALRAGDITVVQLLLDSGADPNLAPDVPAQPPIVAGGTPQEGGRGVPPIVIAMSGDVRRKFTRAPDTTSELQTKRYQFRAERNRTAAIRVLLERGADVNASTAAGVTLLHAAAQQGDDELVRLAAAHGADLMAKDQKGLTALDYARGNAPLFSRGGPADRRACPCGSVSPIRPSTIALLEGLMRNASSPAALALGAGRTAPK
jgi:ankyrin repeat protein